MIDRLLYSVYVVQSVPKLCGASYGSVTQYKYIPDSRAEVFIELKEEVGGIRAEAFITDYFICHSESSVVIYCDNDSVINYSLRHLRRRSFFNLLNLLKRKMSDILLSLLHSIDEMHNTWL